MRYRSWLLLDIATRIYRRLERTSYLLHRQGEDVEMNSDEPCTQDVGKVV